jgi:hypothetical protein
MGGSEPMGFGGRSVKIAATSFLLFAVRSCLSRACQVRLSMNPLSLLLKLLGCSCISMACFTRRSVYLLSMPVSLFLWISCSFPSAATADLPGYPGRRCVVCSVRVISVLLLVCPTYTIPQSHGMLYSLHRGCLDLRCPYQHTASKKISRVLSKHFRTGYIPMNKNSHPSSPLKTT